MFPISWWFFNSAAIAVATTLATIPPLTLYAVAQRRIISTFVTSRIKG